MSNVSIEKNQAYWDDFYKNDFVKIPSQFCTLVATSMEPRSTVVELGCGNGRDSQFLSSANFSVIGVDLSHQAIKVCKASSDKTKDVQFFCGDISDKTISQNINNLLESKRLNGEVSFYSRFVMHSINESQEKLFMQGLKDLMMPGDRVFFEFRSQEDETTKKIYENHYRRYIDTNVFMKALINFVGVEIKYSITGRGMAFYRDEDPMVSRVIAQKK
jgi:SAM-dependent methyltransferase